MIPLGTITDVARIVDYQRFYKPKIKEFVKGFEYEYVQLSFKDIPTRCIYHTSWAKGIWGTPFGMINIHHIKEAMKKDRIRARKIMPPDYFRELFENNPLAFTWNGLHIVFFPRKVILPDGSKRMDPLRTYINGVRDDVLMTKPHSKLYKKWYSKPDAFTFDMRYMTRLDYPAVPGPNVMYRYFDGVFTKDESVFEKITANFESGGPNNPPKPNFTMAPGYHAEHKRRLKETKYANQELHPNMTSRNKEVVSQHVLDDRSEAKRRRIERLAEQEIKEHNAAMKKAEVEQADQKNREKMKQLEVVCLEDPEKMIYKVPRYKAEKLVATEEGYSIVPKHMWKMQLRNQRGERKAITENNRIEPSGVNRSLLRLKPKRIGKFIQHKKKPKQYETETKDGAEYYVEQTEIDKWPEAEYEYIPVVYGATHPKAGQPYMIYGYDDEGNKVLRQAVKRVFKRVNLVKVEKWKRVIKNVS